MKFSLFSKASALIISCAILSLTFLYPYSGDNVLWAYITDLMIGHGIMPYTGPWDHGYPGMVLIHLVQLPLLGRSAEAMHVTDIALHLVAFAYLYRLTARIYGEKSAWFACLLYAIFYVVRGVQTIARTDSTAACLLVIATSVASDPLKKRSHVASLIFGLLLFFRPFYILFIGAYALWQWYRSRNTSEAITACILAIVPFALFIIAYGAAGNIDDLVQSLWSFNREVYYRQAGMTGLFDPLMRFWIMLLTLPIGLVLMLRRWRLSALLLIMIVLSFATLFILSHAPYQYNPLMLLLSVPVGIGLAWVIERLKLRTSWQYAIGITCMLALLVIYMRGTVLSQALKTVASTRSIEAAHALSEPSQLWGYTAQQATARFLQTHTSPGERVQALGPLYPQYMAGCVPSSRFIIPQAFGIRKVDGSLADFQVKWREEYIQDLNAHPPKYFIIADSSEGSRPFLNGLLPHEFIQKDFVQVGEWLGKNYRLDTLIGSFFIYGRK
jgi:hypothetical protein